MKGNFGPHWEPIDLKAWAKQSVELDDVPGLLDAAVAAARAVRDLRILLNELGVPHLFASELVEGALSGLTYNN